MDCGKFNFIGKTWFFSFKILKVLFLHPSHKILNKLERNPDLNRVSISPDEVFEKRDSSTLKKTVRFDKKWIGFLLWDKWWTDFQGYLHMKSMLFLMANYSEWLFNISRIFFIFKNSFVVFSKLSTTTKKTLSIAGNKGRFFSFLDDLKF